MKGIKNQFVLGLFFSVCSSSPRLVGRSAVEMVVLVWGALCGSDSEEKRGRQGRSAEAGDRENKERVRL